MINALIKWSIANRVLVILVSLMLAGAGIFAVKQTPVDAIPDLSDVQVIIKTSYPGQAADVVEQQVTYPLANAMLAVPKAKSVRGFSYFGDSYIYIIFDDDTDLYWARSRVLEYLNQVSEQLPSQARPSLGPDATGVGWVYLYSLIDNSGNYNLAELTSLQDWYLTPELQAVSGVAEIASAGGMIKQYQIELDPFELRAHKLTPQQIKMAVEQSNQAMGAAVVEMAEAEYIITSDHYLQSIEQIENITVGWSAEQTPIQLKDIAAVTMGNQMRRGITEFNGQGETVTGIVVMRYGENAKRVIKAVETKLDQLKQGLPEGVELVTVYNRAELIDNAINHLTDKLVEELIVVSLVCALFLWHLRSSVVAVISLPLGILLAFAIMRFYHINANIMSLAGIAIAIGAMTDGAIVMIENLHKHLAENQKKPMAERLPHWQLVERAAVEVGPALFFSLLIITVSFLPVFMLEGQEGRLFSPLAYTKTFAMAVSAGLAVTLIPVLMGLLIKGEISDESKNPLNRLLISLYQPLLKAALAFPKLTVATILLIATTSIWPAKQISSEFMPPLDEGDIMYMPSTYAGVSIGKARELLQQTNKLIKTIPEVETVLGKIGRADTATDPAPLTMIESFIHLKPKSQWRSGLTKAALMKEFEQLVQFPGLTNAWVMPIKTRIDMLATGIKTPLGLVVSGDDLTTLDRLAKQLESLLMDIELSRSVYAERSVGGRYLNIAFNDQALARYGINSGEVQNLLSIAVGGANISETTEGLARYPINMRFYQDYRQSPEALAELFFTSSRGQIVRLGDIASIEISDGPAVIKSENARLTTTLLIDVDSTQLSQYIAQANQLIAQTIELPTGYSLTWAGQYQYQQRVEEKLTYVIPLTLMIIVLLLYLSFRELTDVLLILTTIPLSLAGGIWLMFVNNYQFSIAVAVGFIALAGVAVELGVIMLVYLKQAQKTLFEQYNKAGEQPSQTQIKHAIIAGAVKRIRPIMMTVATIILGLLPILYSNGTGSEVMSRIAAPMVGGMVSALILTLLLLPCLFYLSIKNNGQS
ncbi:efflux RND transporter permease subunit [Endozoicomonas sp. G2_1]|uniref:efflux RND transporter permease subunit n=1 Tax=Endozoicomonas sp. G2_1 TaxID=2821091 RepID=UPI001ADA959C|nr:CusA/CzcA family heavy metal efflux RND transporter [Endozoicomonas sp. G2_1]MBO9489511.1 efflux RND transporter permease subunit [Endozoicomonas sp. G2_1]